MSDDLGRVALGHRTDTALLVKLTKSRKGRLQWEYTECIIEATRFLDEIEAEHMARKHAVPYQSVTPQDYELAHLRWSQRQQTPRNHY